MSLPKPKLLVVTTLALLLPGTLAGAPGRSARPSHRAASTVDPRFSAVVSPNARLEIVAEHQGWAEGPLYLRSGPFIFADVKANAIREAHAHRRVVTLLHPSGYVGDEPYPGPEPGSSAMVEDARGRVVVAGHAGRAIYRYAAGRSRKRWQTRTTLVDRFEGKRFNSPNDLTVAKDGSIFFTDPPFGLPSQKDGDPRQELKFAGVYRLERPGDADQTLTLVSKAVTGPNGLALSPDEQTLYVADTTARTWVQFARGPDGAFAGPRPFAAVGDDARPGEPDGLAVDRDGHVFAAAPGGVWVFNKDGERLGVIEVPRKTSNVAFGDADRRTLYITASDLVYKIRVKTGG